MLSKEDNDLITKTGPGTIMGALVCQYLLAPGASWVDGATPRVMFHAGAPFNACLSTRSLSPVPGGAGSRSPEIARHAHFLSLTSS